MNTLPVELNIRSKKYVYEDCNPYQRVIYQQLAIQVDELKRLKESKEDKSTMYKAIGVLEYFESFHLFLPASRNR